MLTSSRCNSRGFAYRLVEGHISWPPCDIRMIVVAPSEPPDVVVGTLRRTCTSLVMILEGSSKKNPAAIRKPEAVPASATEYNNESPGESSISTLSLSERHTS